MWYDIVMLYYDYNMDFKRLSRYYFLWKNLSAFRSTKGTDRHSQRRPCLCCYPKDQLWRSGLLVWKRFADDQTFSLYSLPQNVCITPWRIPLFIFSATLWAARRLMVHFITFLAALSKVSMARCRLAYWGIMDATSYSGHSHTFSTIGHACLLIERRLLLIRAYIYN